MFRISLTTILLFSLCACSGTSKSKRSDAEFRCSLAQFGGEPGAADLCRTDCDAGNGEACATLGSMHSRGHLVARSQTDALRLYDRACTLDDTLGCFYAGKFRTASDDQVVRVESLEKVCDAGKMTLQNDLRFACYESATAYLNGFGVAVDKTRGVALAEKACRAGSFEACDGNFASPPVFYAAKISDGEQPIEDSSSEPPAEGSGKASISMKSVSADGLELRDLECTLSSGGGMFGALMVVGVLAKQKPIFDACDAKKDVRMQWNVEGGKLIEASATSDDPNAGECVKNAISSIAKLPDGSCAAILPSKP